MKTKRDGFKVIRDTTTKIGAYAFRDFDWVSFDDVTNIKTKATYVKDMKLGGVMVQTLDTDDFKGTCGCGKFPLLTMLNKVLFGYGDIVDTKCT